MNNNKYHNRKHEFEVIHKNCGHGARSKVSLVKRKSDGKLFIWKRPKSRKYMYQESSRKELIKVKQWRKFGISKVKARWHPDRLSLLKTYIKGPSLKQILRRHLLMICRSKPNIQ